MDRAIRRLKKTLDREGVIRDVRAKRYFNLLIRRDRHERLQLLPKCCAPATKRCSFWGTYPLVFLISSRTGFQPSNVDQCLS